MPIRIMPIRIARTQQPQEPGVTPGTSTVSPVVGFGNPAAAAARTSGQAANLAAQLFQEDRDREVVARVSELDVQRRKADAAVLNSYLQARGKDAVEGRASALAAINENSRSIRSGIQDRAVAEVWNRQDAALTLSAQQDLDAHYRQQNTQWQVDTQEARADQLVNDLGRAALGGGYNPATGQLSVEAERTRSAYHDAIGEMGSILGWSPEQTAVARRKADTAAFSGVARSLIQQNRFEEAARVLERHGDAMDVGTRDQMMALAADGAAQARQVQARAMVQDRAARVADALDAQAGGLLDKLATTKSLFDRGDLTIEERNAADDRLRQSHLLRQQVLDREEKDALEAAQTEAQTKSVGFDGLSPATQKRLETSGASNRFKLWAMQGKQFVTTTVGLAAMLQSDDTLGRIKSREDIVKQLGHELAPDDLKSLLARYDAVKLGKQAPDGWITDAVKIAALDAGLLPSAEDGRPEMSEVDKNRLLRVLHAVRRRASAGDKVATKADIEDAIKKEMGNVVRSKVGPSAGQQLPMSALSVAERDSAYDFGPQGQEIQLPAGSDERRSIAVKRIEIRNAFFRRVGAAVQLDAEHAPTLINELAAMRAEEKSQFVQKTLEAERKRVSDWRSLQQAAYEQSWENVRASNDAAAAREQAARDEALQKQALQSSKTGYVRPGADSPGLKAFKEQEARKLKEFQAAQARKQGGKQ